MANPSSIAFKMSLFTYFEFKMFFNKCSFANFEHSFPPWPNNRRYEHVLAFDSALVITVKHAKERVVFVGGLLNVLRVSDHHELVFHVV
jgi:hypothetical protein